MTILIQNKANTPPDGMEMREDGLQQAIKAAGGIGVLARALRVAQPAVSNWRKIPAERVLSVEAITGVARSMLRPDLYPMDEIAPAGDSAADEIDVLRAQEYDLLAVLLGRAPTREVLDRLSDLKGDASPLGLAHMALAEAAVKADPDALQREFFDLFIGIGRGELLPYASYYLTGFLHERPLASVRDSLSALGIERADNIFEPEDHVAILCEVMAGLAARRFDAEPGAERRFFERHLRPWTPRFFADLETAQAARFYRAVARVGGLFMDIEAEAFAMDA